MKKHSSNKKAPESTDASTRDEGSTPKILHDLQRLSVEGREELITQQSEHYCKLKEQFQQLYRDIFGYFKLFQQAIEEIMSDQDEKGLHKQAVQFFSTTKITDNKRQNEQLQDFQRARNLLVKITFYLIGKNVSKDTDFLRFTLEKSKQAIDNIAVFYESSKGLYNRINSSRGRKPSFVCKDGLVNDRNFLNFLLVSIMKQTVCHTTGQALEQLRGKLIEAWHKITIKDIQGVIAGLRQVEKTLEAKEAIIKDMLNFVLSCRFVAEYSGIAEDSINDVNLGQGKESPLTRNRAYAMLDVVSSFDQETLSLTKGAGKESVEKRPRSSARTTRKPPAPNPQLIDATRKPSGP